MPEVVEELSDIEGACDGKIIVELLSLDGDIEGSSINNTVEELLSDKTIEGTSLMYRSPPGEQFLVKNKKIKQTFCIFNCFRRQVNQK